MAFAMPKSSRLVPVLPALLAAAALHAQDRTLPPVTVSAARSPPAVEKSYPRMVRAMDLFERERALRAPQAVLRFELLPRQPGVNVDDVDLNIVSAGTVIPVPVAPDRSFTLPRDPRALRENAVVTPDRAVRSMTWRAQVRTPGLPANTRRLGDLRLECRVGMEAGLISEKPTWAGRLGALLTDTPAYCDSEDNRYMFFADRPIFGVTLVAGERREALPVRRLWAGALGDERLREWLPHCDCAMLLDRTYYAPLGDARWPDETRVVFDFMQGAAHAP
ncbi:hypothetical protein [Ramlibacter rhizophilus]|uniref:hypothetical protein n=1 Tax=Ramlibacter rhizophilus TaxID=1781167 RepID=UPI001F0E486D|nr:hypothetical protein [Ramlibacter rhizophilus]